MLVLSRKNRQQLIIGDHIRLTILGIQGNTIRLGIEAPQEIRIVRGELAPASEADNTRNVSDRVRSGSGTSQPGGEIKSPRLSSKRNDGHDHQSVTLRLSRDHVSSDVNSEHQPPKYTDQRRPTIPFVPTSDGLHEWLDTLSGSMDS